MSGSLNRLKMTIVITANAVHTISLSWKVCFTPVWLPLPENCAVKMPAPEHAPNTLSW